MSSVKSAFEQAFSSSSNFTETEKVKALQACTFDATSSDQVLTSDHGVKMSDTDNWLRISDGSTIGPSLLEDQFAREKIHRFDHERIPERVVHARGSAAHGYFKVFDNRAAKYTHAPVLTDSSRTTPVFVRFSTVQGSRGSADTVRDVRGFAIKFYTDEGIWDLVGNNIPVFFIQDAIKFPDVIHAVKPEPHNDVPQGQSAHNNFWDFVGLQPESAHMVMWVMSDRGIPRSFRMMQGFGVNTYTLTNADGKRVFVKFHMIPELGVHSLIWDEALKIGGQDPELEEAITNGCHPKWTFAIQTIGEEDEHKFDFDILDATKIWPEEQVPLEIIGELVLNRTVDEFFPEVEQVAFCTSHVVPGIGFSDDPLLQGRNFSYFDTQITRLGINWEQIPINRPVCPVMNHNRGGAQQHRIVKGSLNYFPNRKNVVHPVPPSEGGYVEYKEKVAGVKQRVRGAKFQEHFNQAQLFYNSLSSYEKAHLRSAIAFELSHCDDPQVYQTYTKLLNNIDTPMAKVVAGKVNGTTPEGPPCENRGKKSEPLSQRYYLPKKPTIASRRIAILVADGFNMAEVEAVRGMLASEKATNWIIGPRRGRVYAADLNGKPGMGGTYLVADHHFEGQRSTLFDALYIPSGAEHAKTLNENGRVVHWVREAFGHCKAIAAIGEGVHVVHRAIDLSEIRLNLDADKDNVISSYGVVTTGKFVVPTAIKSTVVDILPGAKGFVSNFAYQISQHRCYEREMDGLTNRIAY